MKEKLYAEERVSEFNYQYLMSSALRIKGMYTGGEVHKKGEIKNRFDVTVFPDATSLQIIGIIEMKAHIDGDMRKHEKEFWKTDQGKRYNEIRLKYGIPVLYCAGPSEINRVARKMYREIYGWKAQLKKLLLQLF
jgi:hypothetical protein